MKLYIKTAITDRSKREKRIERKPVKKKKRRCTQ
jgi:hypothetical protein